MTKIENRIARILEDLIKFSVVQETKFLNDFNVSKSTLRRDFNSVVKYMPYSKVSGSEYGIDLDINLKNYVTNIQRTASYIANDDNPIRRDYLENIFSAINKIPHRKHLRYREIEQFKDYEMTYCIVNEMAIRNIRVSKLIRVFHKLASHQDHKNKKYSEYELILQSNTNLDEELKNKYTEYLKTCNIYSKKHIIDKIFTILKEEYMVSPLQCRVEELHYDPNYNKYTTLQDFNSDSEHIQSILNGEVKLNTNHFYMHKHVRENDNAYVPKKEDGFILEQKKYNKSHNFEYSIIKPSFSRNIIDNNVTTLSINFSLPKEEILAYISHIKDALYSNKQDRRIKTPEELTRNQIYLSSFTKLNKSEIANYFFIYDFVTKRKEILKESYEQEKYEKKAKQVKEEEDYAHGYQYAYGYDEDIEKEHTESIFKDKLLKKQTKLDEKSINRYYYTMYHYIDNLEYRELVNSAFYKPKVDDLRLLSTHEQQAIRKQVIEGFEQNLPIEKISHLTGMSKSRVYALKTQYKKDIDNTLRIKKRGRAPGSKKLSEELDKQIVEKLLANNILWDKDSVRVMINDKLNRQFSISSIVNYLKSKQIKFDNKIDHPVKQMTIKEWIELSFPNIKAEAKKDNAIICWTDAFCKQEIDNGLYLTKIIVYPRTKFMFCLDNSHDLDSFINFLTILIAHYNQMIYLIVDSFSNDSLQTDKKEKIDIFLQQNNKKIKFYK